MGAQALSPRWSRRPEGSNWGDFGPDDQLGRLNLITPQRRLAAVREVQAGLAFTLSLPLDCPAADLQPPFRQRPLVSSTLGGHNLPIGPVFNRPDAPDIGNDDRVTLCTQYSTQWDALSHVGCHFDIYGNGRAEPVYYNGYRAGDDVISCDEQGNSNARALGIDRMAIGGVQGRGVLVNLRKVFGDQKVLVGYEALMGVLEAQGAKVEPGDFLCLYTGLSDVLLSSPGAADRERIASSFVDLDGHDARLLDWISASGLVAICADSISIEAHPHSVPHAQRPGQPILPLHHHCLFKLGVYLGELWYLRELADWLDKHQRSRFLLTSPPLRLPGAVGSPVTPIATV
jgi:kynurenine formamidase